MELNCDTAKGLARFKLSYEKMVRPKVQHAASKESLRTGEVQFCLT